MLIAICLLLAATPSWADDLAPAQQALLLLKVASYDRHLADESDPLEVRVLYRTEKRASREAAQKAEAALSELGRKLKVSGRDVAVMRLPWTDEVLELLDGVDVVFLIEGLDEQLPVLLEHAQTEQILLVSGDRTQVEGGVAVGIVSADGKPALMVNLPAAKASGASFPASFLSIVEVIR